MTLAGLGLILGGLGSLFGILDVFQSGKEWFAFVMLFLGLIVVIDIHKDKLKKSW